MPVRPGYVFVVSLIGTPRGLRNGPLAVQLRTRFPKQHMEGRASGRRENHSGQAVDQKSAVLVNDFIFMLGAAFMASGYI